MAGGIPTGSDPGYLTPLPYSVVGADLATRVDLTEENVRAQLEAEVRNSDATKGQSDLVFDGLTASLGLPGAIVKAILTSIIGVPLNIVTGGVEAVLGLFDGIPAGHIIDRDTGNLVQNPEFSVSLGFWESSETSPPNKDFVVDTIQGYQNPGSARVIGSGATKTLTSTKMVVKEDDVMTVSCRVSKNGGVDPSGTGLKLNVILKNAAGATITTSTAATLSGQGTESFAEFGATGAVVPAGVVYAYLQLECSDSVTAGTFHFDSASFVKSGKIPKNFIEGLVEELGDLIDGTTWNELLSILTGGVSTDPEDVGVRLNWLNPDGTYDASQLANIGNMPPLPDGLVQVPALQDLNDNIGRELLGIDDLFDLTLENAREALASVRRELSDAVTKLHELLAREDAGVGGGTGKSVSIDFSAYPDGPMPPMFNITYTGDVGATSTLGIEDGNACWSPKNNDGNRQAIVVYNGDPTDTDWQILRGTMASPPQDATDNGQPYFYALARVSSTDQAIADGGVSFVFARAWSVGSWFQYRCDIGCWINGMEQIWVSNIPLSWSLNMHFVAGVGNNSRQFQVWSGNKLVKTINETEGEVPTYGDLPTSADLGAAWIVQSDGLRYVWNGSSFPAEGNGLVPSHMGEEYRYWGSRAVLVKGSSSPNDGGKIAACSVSDNFTPSNVGSYARVYRNSSTSVASGGIGDWRVPTNTFDTVEWTSADISFDNGNEFTVSIEGTYLFEYGLKNGPGQINGDTTQGLLYVRENGGSWGIKERGALIHVQEDNNWQIHESFLVYLHPGDSVSPGTNYTNFTASHAGNPAGTYMKLALVNKSLN